MVAGILATGVFAALPGIAETTEHQIVVDTAPPSAKNTPPPMPARDGYVWSPGYWSWSGTAYVWAHGSWVAMVEPAKKWVEPRWSQRGSKWYFTPGHWS